MPKQKDRVATSPGAALTQSPFAALASHQVVVGATSVVNVETEAPVTSVALAPWWSAKVVVRHERKGRGGKTVTRVTGIREERREELLGRMKRALGCGGVVEEEAVVLLGDVLDRVAAWLEAEGAPRVVRGS